MKNFIKKIIIISSMFIICFASTHTLLASSNVPFEYNIIPTEQNNSIINTKVQKKLEFKLYSNIDNVYYNNEPVDIINNTFSIDISNFTGANTITFKDNENNSVSFLYYFSDKKGKVENYELVKGKKLTTYITNVNNVKIIYSNKETSAAKKLVTYLKKLPKNLIENIDTITMIPYENTQKIAGITKNSSITLYKFGKYSSSTQKNILYHEIAHTWANKLMELKIIDYSYTNYSYFVNKDNNYVSTYSKKYITGKNKYNEDFADSVAFFFMNQRSFRKKYPYRFEYINNLTKFKIEKDDESLNN